MIEQSEILTEESHKLYYSNKAVRYGTSSIPDRIVVNFVTVSLDDKPSKMTAKIHQFFYITHVYSFYVLVATHFVAYNEFKRFLKTICQHINIKGVRFQDTLGE